MTKSTLWLIPLLAALLACPALAQENGDLPVPQEGVPVNEKAEVIFEQALEAFEAADYGMAYRRFRLVEREYRLNRKTTAAILMAGKALYRQGEHARAEEVMSGLISEYPSSGYLDEARRVRRFAREQQQDGGPTGETDAFRLGVLLPAPDGERAGQAQALFNGIRMAVDKLNGAAEARPVRMIFRNSGDGGARALVNEGVDAIVGPISSEQARPAARIAERTETVLVAPLATDAEVSAGRDYVFQVNPTFAVRGRQMADFTATSLITVDALAVAAERGSEPSETMAESFRRETRYQERELAWHKQLPGPQGWHALSSQLGAGNVQDVDAIYMPIAGSDADERALAALQRIDQMADDTRILGNSTWHDLPTKQLAGKHKLTYAQPFYADEERGVVRSFRERYRKLAGRAPNRLAYAGYDAARFLVARQRARSQEALREALHAPGTYEGLGHRIDFEEGNVNRALFYLRYRRGSIRLLR
jgi:ABC-type branched-subunit amino acid transport system substrate-binding protein